MFTVDKHILQKNETYYLRIRNHRNPSKMPPNYQNGKIYIIRNTENDLVYIGSTTKAVANRLAEHKYATKDPKKQNTRLYVAMNAIGADAFYIELLEDHPCERKEQLNRKEGELIRAYDSIRNGYNKELAGRTIKEYCIDHRDELNEYKREYQTLNRDKISKRHQEYRSQHLEEIHKKSKEYYYKNREKILKRQKDHNSEHRDELNKKAKEYRKNLTQDQRDKRNAYKRAWNASRKLQQHRSNNGNREEVSHEPLVQAPQP